MLLAGSRINFSERFSQRFMLNDADDERAFFKTQLTGFWRGLARPFRRKFAQWVNCDRLKLFKSRFKERVTDEVQHSRYSPLLADSREANFFLYCELSHLKLIH